MFVFSLKDKIKNTIEETVRDCQTSLFVFDETDKIPIGLIDTIKAYIDYNLEIEGTDFRKAVFIFLRLALCELFFPNITS